MSKELLKEDYIKRIKDLEKELSDQKLKHKKYEIIVDTMMEGIVIDDENEVINFVNPAATELLGYKKDELIGKTYELYVVPELRKKVAKTDKNRADGMSSRYELVMRRKDGKLINVLVSGTPIYKENGDFAGTLGVFIDITELKRIEHKMIKAKAEAEKANRAKSEFLANMSHEIRTPMNGILGFTQLLNDTKLTDEQKDYIRTIDECGNQLLLIINEILDLSKIEAGGLEFDIEEFDPEITTFDVSKLILPKIGDKQVEVICNINDNVPSYIKGDPAKYRQVLMNLMGNASKFIQKGEIELSLNVLEEIGNRVKLEAKVRDTGIGIPKSKLKSIFNPFQQADGSTTRRFGGTGLGLSISKRIANHMGGDVWAESKLGKGSTFYFSAWFEKASKKAKKYANVSLAGKKVIIVDDIKNNLKVLSRFLKNVKMDVVAVTNGREAIKCIKNTEKAKKHFDFCITDIQMPEMSGYDLVKKIRDMGYLKIPIIALSSSLKPDVKICRQVGFNGYLHKPINREKLYDLMESILVEGESEEKEIKAKKIHTQYSIKEDKKHSACILLAEDNIVSQRLANFMLTKAGYSVSIAQDGKEAVKMYTESPEKYDLILMDIQMPVMDGRVAATKIREAGFKDIPIIAMTAEVMKGDEERCLKAGMNDYIPKPIKREYVFEILNKYVFEKT